nr:hypothetical protein [Tanacetum cinerariifolium]
MQPIAPPSPYYVPGPEHPLSPNYVPGLEHPPSPVETPYVPELEYPEYLGTSDDEAPLEDQHLPADASPTTVSSGYVADFDPDKDPKEDPEDDHADYPANGGDGDDEPFDDDDDDDDTDDGDEKPFEDKEDEKEEEGHLATTDSSVVPIVDLTRLQEGLPYFPRSLIRGRKSSAAEAARQLGPTESDHRRYRVEQAGYGITDTWDEIVDTLMEIALTTLEGTQLTTALGRIKILEARDLEPQEGPAEAGTSWLSCMIIDVVMYGERDVDRSRNGDNNNDSGIGERRKVTTQRECTYTDFLKCQPMSFLGTEGVVGLTRWLEKIESVFQISNCTVTCQVKFASCTLGEIQKLESEYWNLKVKGLDLLNYKQRFQELALMCDRMFPEESTKVEKYIAIEFATKMMDKKLLTHAKCQARHNRKFDDTSRYNQHQQQPFKRNNVARAYTVGLGDKKPYDETKPLCPKCNYYHDRPCTPKCTNYKKIGHSARDCKSRPGANNNQNAHGENERGITCFECGVQGHYKSYCPNLKNGNQGNRAGNKNAVATAYAVGTVETNSNSNVVSGTFLLNNRYASILFDTGADRSFISTAFSTLIDIIPTTLDHGYDVKLADGRIIWVNTLIWGCTLNFLNHLYNIDLMPIEMGSFDVIINMDLLVKHHAIIFCDEKLVRVPFDNKILIFMVTESTMDTSLD